MPVSEEILAPTDITVIVFLLLFNKKSLQTSFPSKRKAVSLSLKDAKSKNTPGRPCKSHWEGRGAVVLPF